VVCDVDRGVCRVHVFGGRYERDCHPCERCPCRSRDAAPATPQQALTLKVKELWQRQHDLEYSDPEIARVRKDIVELERQLVARRKDLADRLARKPEIQQLEQERLTLIRQLQQATPAAAPKP
jgi:hypothetical protein